MGKQLDLTKKEQKEISDCMCLILDIMSSKMNSGVDSPCIEGEIDIESEGRVLTFSFELTNK